MSLYSSTSVLLVVAIFFILAVTVAAFSARYRQQERKQRQTKGISWLQSLRKLLAHIQQHRGLGTAYLNGESSLLSKIQTVQQNAGREINAICNIDPTINDDSTWQAITQHWAKVSGNFTKYTAGNNIDQHDKLIQNILYFIDDMAQDHDLLLLHSRNGIPLHFAWRELLTAAECIGQTRALGMGVVASARCDTISRIRMNYLCQKIERTTAAAWEEIPPSSDQKEKVATLVLCIKEDIVQRGRTIDVDSYFKVATDAIDGLHEQYDEIVNNLQ